MQRNDRDILLTFSGTNHPVLATTAAGGLEGNYLNCHDLAFILSFIKDDSITERLYQRRIADAASTVSTLVVLPTGLGKTVIALLVIDIILQSPGSKVLFMAPTKPLVEQHYAFLRERLTIDPELMSLMTGETAPEHRPELWNKPRIVVSTPQVVENDVSSGLCDLSSFSLLVFDECHRAKGDYSYVHISEVYSGVRERGLVLGMTASPGSDLVSVEEICRTLNIEHIEVRSEDDPDVEPYVQETAVKWVPVELSQELRDISRELKSMLSERVEKLRHLQLIPQDSQGSTKDLLGAGRELSSRLSAGMKHRILFDSMRIQSEAVKLSHGVDMAETQTVFALRRYVQKLQEEAEGKSSKASRSIVADERFQLVVDMLSKITAEHPKISKLTQIIGEQLAANPSGRIMVFTQFRDTAEIVYRTLSGPGAAKPIKLIGQSARRDERGLKQKEQIDVISRFSSGEANVLISTSVGEEGLDITSTDMVVFYETVPSEIRSIQRRGRTGRLSSGKVFVLVTRGTKDEGFYYSSLRKENSMKAALMSLNARLSRGAKMSELTEPKQKSLFDY